ncbi:MAG: selenocysteine-specific translation elongation factor [Chitinispirillaceae bacterium]|nr:selenocysteine-specific translation elongation factor [Chitinispirillaceae bacterium]
MKHLILGTAGHVDHGKTALVKALTGVDCDTHTEEKRRGITINLGFAHLVLPCGDTIGIVDMPGHRDFIHTMVSGANGIDIALLVVAADSGIMPQTREHVRIMELLGLATGIVALTRIDLAAPGQAKRCAAELADFVKGTFLESAPVVRVSATTGEGIEALRAAIEAAAAATPERPRGEGFRLYIDRIFSVAGFGTVVTGSVLSGALKTGDRACLLPMGRELRVRRLERYGREVGEVCAGDRASLNLTGLTREEFVRGMMVADRLLRSATMLDARIELFESSRTFPLWSQALFLMGTFEAQTRIHLIDQNALAPGSAGIAQIHFQQACVAQFGDRFVLRSSSGDMTLGGGEIIDSAPLHHRRRPQSLITRLERLVTGNRRDYIAEEVRKQNGPISLDRLAATINLTSQEVGAVIDALPGDLRTVTAAGNALFFISGGAYEKVKSLCIRAIETHHRENPLVEEGKTAEELYGMAGFKNGQDDLVFLRSVLEELARQGTLKAIKHTWALSTHAVRISGDFERQVRFVESFIRESGMKIPLHADIEAGALKNGIDRQVLKQVLHYLVKKGRIHAVDGNYIHTDIVSKCRCTLVEALNRTPAGLTVAQFRDLVEGNRKICLALLTMYDAAGITERKGDIRVLGKKGACTA